MIREQKPDIPQGYLTSEQVSRTLAISKRTLHRWGRQRKGPPRIKIGRQIYYRSTALENWLLAHEEDYGATVAGRR